MIGNIAFLVHDYDDAITFFTEKLSFSLLEDLTNAQSDRWVVITPPKTNGTNLMLSKADTILKKEAVGQQAGDAVFLILKTNDFWHDYNKMKSHGIEFLEDPRTEPYGTVVIFKDLYGNKWDLIQEK